MKFLVSFPFTNKEYFDHRDEQHRKGFVNGSSEVFDGEPGGKIVLYESKNSIEDTKLISQFNATRPYGFQFVDGEGIYFISGNICKKDGQKATQKISRLNASGAIDLEIESPLFSHLHSVTRTKNGLLVTSSGLDVIVETNLDGKLVWEWSAAENGYDTRKDGSKREVDGNVDHRLKCYPTLSQTTHVNSATEDSRNSEYILATLFHQGQIIRINRGTKKSEIIISGLDKPHHLREQKSDYNLVEPRAGNLVICDKQFEEIEKLNICSWERTGPNKIWLQDAIKSPRGTYILLDDSNFRFLEIDEEGNKLGKFNSGEFCRSYQIEIVPESFVLPRAS